MKRIILILSVVLLSSFVNPLWARGPLWNCGLTFKAKTRGIQVLVGNFTATGKGTIRCLNVTGETIVLPVNVQLGGDKFAANIAVGKMQLFGVSHNITLFTDDPEAVLGKYRIASLQGALGYGVGSFTGVHSNIPSLRFVLSLQTTKGLGINLGFNKLRLTLEESF